MRKRIIVGLSIPLFIMIVGVDTLAEIKGGAPEGELNKEGRKLEKLYNAELESIRTELLKLVPTVDQQKRAAVLEAWEVEESARMDHATARKNMSRIYQAEGLVRHAKYKWIADADKNLKMAKAKLENAKTDAERDGAEKDIAKWQKNRADGVAALQERKAALAVVMKDKGRFEKAYKKAELALNQAMTGTLQAVNDLGLQEALSDDQLDTKLAKFAVLKDATPHALALFAQQGEAQSKLIDQMLSSGELLLQMAVADGAKGRKYGEAMQIYSEITKASDKCTKGPLQRLALAVALEHAVPIEQIDPKPADRVHTTIDPVERYLHYEKAFLSGELDSKFRNFGVWDYRWVVNGGESSEVLNWGREMLRNYRPGLITINDYRRRYVSVLGRDVLHNQDEDKNDKQGLYLMQNIFANGGSYERRALFGRFMLRSFGMPAKVWPKRGDSSLIHWTPAGWNVFMDGKWRNRNTEGRNGDDFLINHRGRATGQLYKRVKRAQWIGELMGIEQAFGIQSGAPQVFWYALSCYTWKEVISVKSTGELGKHRLPSADAVYDLLSITQKDREMLVDGKGVITVPVAATTTKITKHCNTSMMRSHLGGKQFHYSDYGKVLPLEYIVTVPSAGEYAFEIRVVTPGWGQLLLFKVNEVENPLKIALPYAEGNWSKSKPVIIALKKGENQITILRRSDDRRGVTIKDFTLTPVK